MTVIQTALSQDVPVVVRQDLYNQAGVERDAVCGDSGATAERIAQLWADCGGDQKLFDEGFKALAEENGASGECSGHCVRILDALKAEG